MTISKEQIVEALKGLTLMEAADLVKELEEVFGVSAAPVAAAPAAGAAPAAAEEEKTEFDVILSSVGDGSKLAIIKEVRALTGLALKEAKELVEGAPKPVKTAVSKADANEAKEKLEAAGAKVELK